MWREPGAVSDLQDRASVERLAATLLTIGADQEVRVLEALAATLVNGCGRDGPSADIGVAEPEPPAFLHQTMTGDCDPRLALGRRIARRALRGSLVDPTRGATAFHRLDANPAWARDLLPVAVIGSFLFYRLFAPE
jgi:cell wall hydrolase